MITFDLKSGHHDIEIHSDHLRFWGFAWKFPGKLPYDILCLQFFLLVCFLHLTFLQNVLNRFEKYWRFNGINIVLFLDDGWLIDSDRDTCAVLATMYLV